jgi:hypothetical protein
MKKTELNELFFGQSAIKYRLPSERVSAPHKSRIILAKRDVRQVETSEIER